MFYLNKINIYTTYCPNEISTIHVMPNEKFYTGR